MLIVLWVSYLLTMIIYVGFDPLYSSSWPPVGIGMLVVLTILRRVLKNEVWMMYLISSLIFVYLFWLNIEYPYLVNYIYILLGVILTSLYQQYGVTIFSGALATFSLTYFYLFHFDDIFNSIEPVDIGYFIVLAVMIVIFFLFHIKFTKSLWVRAQIGENRAKEKLQSTESYLRAFFKQTKDAIVVYDLNGRIINVNDSFCRLYGWEYEALMQTKISQVIPLDWEETMEIETQHLQKEGHPLIVAKSTSLIKDLTGEPVAYLMLIRDVSEQKMTEDKLRQSEKLKVVGELAAGIAHEIRNPITVLSGFTQLMGEENHYKGLMQTELNRIDGIVDELLVLAKPRAMELSRFSPKDVLDEVLELFHSICENQQVRIQWNRCDQTIIQGDRNRLKQVIMNVFKNALEAIGFEGTIEIDVIKRESDVQIEIANDGPFIPVEVLREIGKPFYTTKNTGTGLGLMISTTIMKEHNGCFDIGNRASGGVVVTLSIPTVD